MIRIATLGLLLAAGSPLAPAAPMAAKTYYVDAAAGKDANSGLSPAQSWQTLAAVNALTLGPGDAVLFRAGQQWSGALVLAGRGSEGQPIRIGRYGEGAMPRIEGDAAHEDAVLLRNMDEVEVSDLEITNRGDGSGMRRGLRVLLWNFGVAHHVVLRHLFIHDVGGTLAKKDSGGIQLQAFGDVTASRFDDVLIERNVVLHVDRTGIGSQTDRFSRKVWFPSTKVVIRENYVEDVGGDGIVPIGTDHAVVEGNVVRRAVSRSKDYNAGVWPWSADDTFLQWNDVAGTGGTRDGEGYDSDYNSHNTRFEHNYSHDNMGGFMLICTPGDSDPAVYAGNTATRVVGNISYGDHTRIFNISGGKDTVIEKNLFVVPRDAMPGDKTMQLVVFTYWQGWARDVTIDENRFFVEGNAESGNADKSNDDGTFMLGAKWGAPGNVRFDRNVYLRRGSVEPMESTATLVDAEGLEGVDWSGPQFDAARDGRNVEAVDRFFVAHDIWIRGLFHAAHVD
jgi:hypothetical protein